MSKFLDHTGFSYFWSKLKDIFVTNDKFDNSLTNENNETFNFGVLNGVRGFFTDSSRADDSFIPFSSYKNMMYIDNSSKSGSATATLLVPESVTDGIIMFMNIGYTNIASPSISIPSDVNYEDVFPLTKLDRNGNSGSIHTYMNVIKANNISGKTFEISTNGSYYRSFIWLFY